MPSPTPDLLCPTAGDSLWHQRILYSKNKLKTSTDQCMHTVQPKRCSGPRGFLVPCEKSQPISQSQQNPQTQAEAHTQFPLQIWLTRDDRREASGADIFFVCLFFVPCFSATGVIEDILWRRHISTVTDPVWSHQHRGIVSPE